MQAVSGAAQSGLQWTVVVRYDPVGDSPVVVATGHEAVWVTDFEDGTVSRLGADPTPLGPAAFVGEDLDGIDLDDDGAWVVSQLGTVTHLDVESNFADDYVLEEGAGSTKVAVGHGFVWIVDRESTVVRHLDPESREVEEIRVGNLPVDIAIGPSAVWVTNQGMTW